MRARMLIAAALLLAVGCGNTAQEPETPAAEALQAGPPAMRAEALELHSYPPGSSGEAQSKPVLTLRAEAFSQDPETGRYEIEGVHIEIAEDPERGAVVLDGGSGIYEEDKQAQLMGGVRIALGETRIETEALTYDVPDESNPGVLYTGHPVTIKGPEQDLRAEALRVLPGTRQMILKQPRGKITLGDMGL